MKFWGAVVRAFLPAMSLFFVVVTFVVTHDRAVAIAAAALLAAAGFFGVPALVRLFTSFPGDEDVLRTGDVTSAAVMSFRPTGWRYNRHYPIVQFELSVSAQPRGFRPAGNWPEYCRLNEG